MRQAIEATRLATSDALLERKVAKETLKILKEVRFEETPLEVGRKVHLKVKEITSNQDPYREVKKRFNRLGLQLYPKLKKIIRQKEDSLLYSIKAALFGNQIDFAVSSNIDLPDPLESLEGLSFTIFDYGRLRAEFERARKILYLADNAGEIAFDKLLIEEFVSKGKEVTVAVRDKPIINDATYEDAEEVSLTELVRVITTGFDGAGVLLPLTSYEFQREFEGADLVISKGQGNFEGLSQEEGPIFFLLKAKCPVIAKELALPVGSTVLKRSSFYKRRSKL